MIFRDRRDAGRQLASKLGEYARRDDVVVLALPRGGVPVAYEVANALNAPLDIYLVRKLGVPGHEELAMGAIAPGGTRVLNRTTINYLKISDRAIEEVAEKEQRELERRTRAYRDNLAPIDIRDKVVILVDDGLATGATMHAAAIALKASQPSKVIVAVPVASHEACESFRREVDEVVCAITPEPFYGVGQWYLNFSQTTDEEVRELLDRARAKS
jgi:putative phosphoribosyl transferase